MSLDNIEWSGNCCCNLKENDILSIDMIFDALQLTEPDMAPAMKLKPNVGSPTLNLLLKYS